MKEKIDILFARWQTMFSTFDFEHIIERVAKKSDRLPNTGIDAKRADRDDE